MDKTLAQTLVKYYQHHPEKDCIHLIRAGMDDHAITYSMLFNGAKRYTALLQQNNIKAGDIVILIFQHGVEQIYAYWGTILAGAVPSIMPFLTEKLLPDKYHKDLTSLLDLISPSAILTYPQFKTDFLNFGLGEQSAILVLTYEDNPGEEQAVEHSSFQGLFVVDHSIAILQHSSGSTGLQKGVALSHKSIFNQIDIYAESLALRPTDVIVSWLPLYHDMGLIAGYLLPILFGIPLVLLSPFDWVRAPQRLFQAVSRYNGTLTWLPNFAFNFCAQKIRDNSLQDINLSSLRAVINCSEPVKQISFEQFLNRFLSYGLNPLSLSACYAMAENTFAISQTEINVPPRFIDVNLTELQYHLIKKAEQNELSYRIVSCGHPLPNVNVKIVNAQNMELGERQVGEIAIQSNCMLTEYYCNPEATRSAFIDNWFLTGDLGFFDQGELFITGRKKDLIIVGGKNIYPQDLESLASEVSGVHKGRTVAFGVFQEDIGTEEVVLIAEIEDQYSNMQQSIAEQIRTKITRESDVALRQVYIVGSNWLIKTSSGKVARKANKQKYLNQIIDNKYP